MNLCTRKSLRDNVLGFSFGIKLVAPLREIWNGIFSDLETLCERLEGLDIEFIKENSDNQGN